MDILRLQSIMFPLFLFEYCIDKNIFFQNSTTQDIVGTAQVFSEIFHVQI